MIQAQTHVPLPANEAVRNHAPGSPERHELRRALMTQQATVVEIPLVIGGRAVSAARRRPIVCPHDHGHVLAQVHSAEPAHVAQAIAAAAAAWPAWSRTPWAERAAIFLRAAELLATRWRATINAATMLAQSKTPHQAEIDAACELIDFWRFNPYFAERLFQEQPQSAPGSWNYADWRPLEGFVLAITPFNFTSITANLATAPALLGNVVLWKPAHEATLAAHYLLELLTAAGLPPGVINLLPGEGRTIGPAALGDPNLAGVHFTGSTPSFNAIWREVGAQIARYRNYPRLVGETGGKDFIVAHPSADEDALLTALIRGAFEYQGQKCSAVSRAYLPRSLWLRLEARLADTIAALPMGDPCDFKSFVGAVINRHAWTNIRDYLELARGTAGCRIVAGGSCSDTHGFFVHPTLIESEDPRSRLMTEEIFGPVLTCHVYEDQAYEQVLTLCDQTSPFGLTGAVFAREQPAIGLALDRLRHAAGNFYINDKPTGAVVGQQPFGGARASGTNDKAGSGTNLLRWVTPRVIKENLAPPHDYRYPYMEGDAADDTH
ncbi:MAG: L-glutamate gamma-semialdehyde dehydrogenase [Proteobacteria bacterium]|nr:L-glutamate gamma-semialdehyde dehydrogenase [Pseudomonadota bacterium]